MNKHSYLRTLLSEDGVVYAELVFGGNNTHIALAFRCQQYVFLYEHAYKNVSLVDAQVLPKIPDY